MKTPDIAVRNTKTSRRAYRDRAPFIIANRLDLILAREKGCTLCGYKGKAITFVATEAAPRSPATLTTVSRTSFLKALAGSKMMCYNCAVEGRGDGGRPRKRCVSVCRIDTSSLQAALALESALQGDKGV